MNIFSKTACNIIPAIMLAACTSNGFKTHESGLEYRFIEQHKQDSMAKQGEVLTLRMKYVNEKDSVLFDTRELIRPFKMQMKAQSHNGGCIEDAFSLMHVGDSAVFRIDAYNFYTETREMEIPSGVRNGSKLTFFIRLINIQTMDEIEKERENKQIVNEDEEMNRLQHYLKIANIKLKSSASGLYFIEQVKGKGKNPVKGNTVTVHYTGTFLSGKPFDSSYERNEPWIFTIGSEQAIPGFEEGVCLMQEGGQSQLIIPSKLAYGKDGINDLIPPFSTLVFYIELLKVE